MKAQSDSTSIIAINSGWSLTSTPANTFDSPQALPQSLLWQTAQVPGTVAASLHANGSKLLKNAEPLPDLDDDDWWYRTSFVKPDAFNACITLNFDGLATLAEIWLNGELLLTSNNMFVSHRIDVSTQLQNHNDLVIRFKSLNRAIEQRKPRPRWKTRLVKQQNLRWIRTTLLGHTSSWAPHIAAVGPWRGIYLEIETNLITQHIALTPSAQDNCATLKIECQLVFLKSQAVQSINLRIKSDSQTEITTALPFALDASQIVVDTKVELPGISLWWPHTHGQPNRHECAIDIHTTSGILTLNAGLLGFRQAILLMDDTQTRIQINGTPVFCRGACWTTQNILSLNANSAELRSTIKLVHDAGFNMLRIGGTMHYESDEFFDLCDEYGIMIWHEFMFANMDYPVQDENFIADVTHEIHNQLNRLRRHACITVYCGNSEIEQQIAMLGLSEEHWSNAFFTRTLPELCAQLHNGIPYVPSSPTGGILPIHVNLGVAHYYGVGAYKRPLEDARRAGVKFASECLGFSNVPEPETLASVFGDTTPVAHHPVWKTAVPRDNGSGWDFEDIRDFYLQTLFKIDAIKLRSYDSEQYFMMSRVTSGEVMKTVLAEWRRSNSGCGGALIWFLKDLMPGAGWGVIDSENRPKAAYYYLRRACAPQTVLMTDEGVNALSLHVINDRAQMLKATIELETFQHACVKTSHAITHADVPAHDTLMLNSDALLGRFTDINYAYKFGPPAHDVVIARLIDTDSGIVLGEDAYFPLGLSLPKQDTKSVHIDLRRHEDGHLTLIIESAVFLQSVHVEIKNFRPVDNYFHVSPSRPKTVVLLQNPHTNHATTNEKIKIRGSLSALNLHDSITLSHT